MTIAASLPRAAAAPALASGLAEFADRYDVVLCDLWGVMHDGATAFAPAIDALVKFRAQGGTVVFITNAPRPRGPVEAQILGLGIPADAYDGIVTSGDVTIAAIAEQGDKAFHHIGPARDLALFAAVDAASGGSSRLTGLDAADCVVVTGLFDDATETPADYAASLAAMRRRHLPMICANPDIVVHVGDQLIYCGGALAEAYAAIGGRTLLAGKPHAPIYEAALALAGEHAARPVERARVLAIGDGLVTDVAGAAHQGLAILFVTRGIHRDDFHGEAAGAASPDLYRQRLAALEHPPLAALPHLVW